MSLYDLSMDSREHSAEAVDYGLLLCRSINATQNNDPAVIVESNLH